MTIVGTRPELIKLSRVMAELEIQTDHVLVHTGQNYDHELNAIFFKEMKLQPPKHVLDVAGKTAAESIGKIIAQTDEVMEKEKPEALLLYGDTNSCLSVIAAKRRKIPVFHMEAGNRSFDERVPEEINRRLVDHLSDINLPLTEHGRRYLLSEGIRPETVIKTGSTVKEILTHYQPQIEASDVLKRLGLSPKKFFVMSAHREENVDVPERLSQLVETFRRVAGEYKLPVIVSTHPRTRKRLEDLGISEGSHQKDGIQFLKPMGLFDYVKLQRESFCVVTDSGAITEESSILGFPAVMIRDAHERPEGMDEGALIMCGLRAEHVLDSIRVVTEQVARLDKKAFRVPPDYDVDNVSKKVVRVILSYIDYVNRTVWKK